MKKLFAVVALCLWLPLANAALTVTQGKENQGNPPAALTFATSISSGSAIVACFGGTTNMGSLTVTDNVNTGSYSLLVYYAAASGACYWKVANATGTPTISITGQGGYTYADMFAISGFTGTPTSDVSIQATASGTGTTVAINATSLQNNEVLITMNGEQGITNLITPGPTGWTRDATNSGFNVAGYYAIEATSGTVNNFSAPLGSSSAWFVQLAGIYDSGGGSSCTHSGYTSSGSITVPTASSTSVLLKNGSYGTVDCATTNYWQPTVGSFGVN